MCFLPSGDFTLSVYENTVKLSFSVISGNRLLAVTADWSSGLFSLWSLILVKTVQGTQVSTSSYNGSKRNFTSKDIAYSHLHNLKSIVQHAQSNKNVILDTTLKFKVIRQRCEAKRNTRIAATLWTSQKHWTEHFPFFSFTLLCFVQMRNCTCIVYCSTVLYPAPR